MPVAIRKYKDLDLTLAAHPITGKLFPVTDADAVKRSIMHIVLTNNYEKPFDPDHGSNVNAILFAPTKTPFAAYQLESAIESAIVAREPRCQLIKVKASLDHDLNGFYVNIVFAVKTIPQPIEMVMFLRRTR